MLSILCAHSYKVTNENTGNAGIILLHTKFMNSTKVTRVDLENLHALH